MPVKEFLTLSKSSRIFAILIPMVGMIAGQAKAEGFNTGFVLNKMPLDERVTHIDGVVRGIAFASYFHKDKDNAAFECTLNYATTGDNAKWESMLDFAQGHPDKPLGGVLFVYLRKKCGL